MGAPCYLLASEVLSAYPEAKVILTNRDVDAWARPMSATFFRKVSHHAIYPYRVDTNCCQDPFSLILGPYLDPYLARVSLIRPRGREFYSGGRQFEENGKQMYVNHYNRIRQLVSPDRLLEYSVKQGREPLCAFVDKPVPDTPFPRVNSTDEFLDHTSSMYNMGVWLFFKRILVLFVAPIGIAASAAYIVSRMS